MNRITEREGMADLTFWVYYGNETHVLRDMPLWMYRAVEHIFPSSLEFVGEYPSEVSGVRVLVVASFGHPEELSQKGMVDRMNRVADFNARVGGMEIVPGGVIPNSLRALGVQPVSPVSLENDRGPVFAITYAVEHEFSRKGLVRGQDAIAVIGIGRIGGLVMNRFRSTGHRVVAVEKTRRGTIKGERILYTNDSWYILEQDAQIIVVITRRGSDIAPDIKNFPVSATVFDESFPQIEQQDVYTLQTRGNTVARIFLTGIQASRAFGGYATNEIPACLVQPMVRVVAQKFERATQRTGESIQDWVDRVAGEVLGIRPNIAT
jgi:hypothetical protein